MDLLLLVRTGHINQWRKALIKHLGVSFFSHKKNQLVKQFSPLLGQLLQEICVFWF
jgi:hypothetical protein